MESEIFKRKKREALARRKRKQVLNERRLKRNRVDENKMNFPVCFSRYNHPTIDNIRTPLSNITSSVLNERNHFLNEQPKGNVISYTQRKNNMVVNQFDDHNRHYVS